MWYRSPKYTICEVLRDIFFDAGKIGSDKIQLQARIATAMAKAMDKKLKEYDKSWTDGFYDENTKPRKTVNI